MSEHIQQLNGIEGRVTDLENTVYGDRTNPNERPGLIVEHVRIALEQKRTNEILIEFRSDVKKAVAWLFALILTGIIGAIFALIFKNSTLTL